MTLGGEFLVSPPSLNHQIESANASSSNGNSVAVWAERVNNQYDIRGRVYNPAGQTIANVSTSLSLSDDLDPSVAMDSKGNFVVTWTRTELAFGNTTEVMAQRFNAAGVAQGGIFRVSDDISRNEYDSDVAMDANGNFVVAFTKDVDASNPDVVARRYNSAGGLVQFINTQASVASDDFEPSVAMSPDGRFALSYAYTYSDPGRANVWLTRYSASGSLLSGTDLAATSIDERDPDIAMDNFGNAVVAYQKFVGDFIDVKARRVTSSGSIGSEIDIASKPDAHQYDPAVALNRTTGSFVVAYNYFSFAEGTEIRVAEVSGVTNAVVTTHASFTADDNAPALSIDAQGNYFLSYTGSVGQDYNIYGRRGRRL